MSFQRHFRQALPFVRADDKPRTDYGRQYPPLHKNAPAWSCCTRHLLHYYDSIYCRIDNQSSMVDRLRKEMVSKRSPLWYRFVYCRVDCATDGAKLNVVTPLLLTRGCCRGGVVIARRPKADAAIQLFQSITLDCLPAGRQASSLCSSQ